MSTADTPILRGSFYGAGAAVNVELGFVPKMVLIYNVTDGNKAYMCFTDDVSIPFTSGGVNPIAARSQIKGVTSGAKALVRKVELLSGTFAGGDAAGFFLCDSADVTGTFQAENVTIQANSVNYASGATDDATVAAQVEHGIDLVGNAAVSGATGIVSYQGDATHKAGFTVGATLATNAKFFRWMAFRH